MPISARRRSPSCTLTRCDSSPASACALAAACMHRGVRVWKPPCSQHPAADSWLQPGTVVGASHSASAGHRRIAALDPPHLFACLLCHRALPLQAAALRLGVCQRGLAGAQAALQLPHCPLCRVHAALQAASSSEPACSPRCRAVRSAAGAGGREEVLWSRWLATGVSAGHVSSAHWRAAHTHPLPLEAPAGPAGTPNRRSAAAHAARTFLVPHCMTEEWEESLRRTGSSLVQGAGCKELAPRLLATAHSMCLLTHLARSSSAAASSAADRKACSCSRLHSASWCASCAAAGAGWGITAVITGAAGRPLPCHPPCTHLGSLALALCPVSGAFCLCSRLCIAAAPGLDLWVCRGVWNAQGSRMWQWWRARWQWRGGCGGSLQVQPKCAGPTSVFSLCICCCVPWQRRALSSSTGLRVGRIMMGTGDRG